VSVREYISTLNIQLYDDTHSSICVKRYVEDVDNTMCPHTAVYLDADATISAVADTTVSVICVLIQLCILTRMLLQALTRILL
jgi:hypothetical protein